MKLRLALLFCALVIASLIFTLREDIRRAVVRQTVSLSDGTQIEMLDVWVYDHRQDGYWADVLCSGSYGSSRVNYRLGNLSAGSSPIDKNHFMIHVPIGIKPVSLEKLSLQFETKSGIPTPVDIRLWANPKDGIIPNQY